MTFAIKSQITQNMIFPGCPRNRLMRKLRAQLPNALAPAIPQCLITILDPELAEAPYG
jgi:hypothetical protein